MRHYYKQFLHMSEQSKQNVLILQSLYPSRNANIWQKIKTKISLSALALGVKHPLN